MCYTIYSQFVQAATAGAIAVVQGQVAPVNPGESKKTLVCSLACQRPR